MVRQNEIAPTIGITCEATVLNIFRVQAPTRWSLLMAQSAQGVGSMPRLD